MSTDATLTPVTQSRAPITSNSSGSFSRSGILARGDYTAVGALGRGGFSSVYKATSNSNQSVYAVKVISRRDAKSLPQDEAIAREIDFIKHLKHPLIIGYEEHYSLDEEYHVVLEFAAGGSLAQKAPVNHRLARSYTLDIAEAINFLHENDVIHCDLKPENVLLGSDGRIKLADFGLAIRSSDSSITGVGGTPYARSPEVLCGGPFTKAIDYWGLGITLYVTVTNKEPFDSSKDHLDYRILAKEPKFSPYDVPTFRKLVEDLLRKEPGKRLSCLEGVVKHEYFNVKGGFPLPWSLQR